MQAWRRVPSHFNRDSGFDSAVSTALAAGGGVIVICAAVMAAAAFRATPLAAASMALAIRCGLVGFVLALGTGVGMIVRGVSLQRSGSPEAAYDDAGSLKPAHATTMHAILILPAIAWLLSFTPWTERTRTRLVLSAALGYALTALTIFAESVSSVDPLAAPMVLSALTGIGATVVVVIGALAMVRALRSLPTSEPV